MKNIASPEAKPPTLIELVDSYNSGRMSVEDFAKSSIPLLAAHRQEGIICFVMKLVGDHPNRYRVGSPYHARLWAEAEAAYDADIRARLASQPAVLEKLEETYRRVEAKFRSSEKRAPKT